MSAAHDQRLAEFREWESECEAPSNWDAIAYWATVLIAGISTTVVVFGGIGYLAGLYR